MKGRQIVQEVSFQVPAGKANPSPPVGTALGPHGINIMDFCNQFNEGCRTAVKNGVYSDGDPVRVIVHIFKDRSFEFSVKLPPTSFLLLKELGVKKGSSAPGKESAGEVSHDIIKKIAQKKQEEIGVLDINSAVKSVEGTAISMGFKIQRKD